MTTLTPRETRTGGAILRTLGALYTYQRAGTSGGQTLAALVTRETDPVWSSGQGQVSEEHWQGYVLVAVLAEAPALGDALIAEDGTRYEVDQAPAREHGLWSLVLRRYAA